MSKKTKEMVARMWEIEKKLMDKGLIAMTEKYENEKK